MPKRAAGPGTWIALILLIASALVFWVLPLRQEPPRVEVIFEQPAKASTAAAPAQR